MNHKEAAQIADTMLAADAFSRWLGVRIIGIQPGKCHATLQVTPDMCNGFGVAHGGIAFSLADSACSFAVNAHGRKAMSVDNTINQFKAIQEGDVLHCYATEESLGKKIGVCRAEIMNQDEVKVAVFKGTYYRSDKQWFGDEE